MVAILVVQAKGGDNSGETAVPAALASAVAVTPAPGAATPATGAPAEGGLRVLRAAVAGSISQTLTTARGERADALSAEVSRLLVWDLDLRRDLRAGDELAVAWEGDTAETLVVHALRLRSQKLGRAIEAYRFQAPGDEYPSYWSPDGTEVPRRLERSPIEGYEQITSLLKDRPRHHGMDFMAKVGTPVTSPWDGTVTRVNWNLAANGRCVEIRFPDGVLAKYLHLSRTDVKAGERVTAGHVVGLSGNTGRSTGPHLHYQLNRGKAVVDPIDYHGTTRRTLPEADLPRLEEAVRPLRDSLAQPGSA